MTVSSHKGGGGGGREREGRERGGSESERGGGRGERKRGREKGVREREGGGREREGERGGGRGGSEREGGERGGGREREGGRERQIYRRTERERRDRDRERGETERKRDRERERDVQMPKTVVRTDAYTTLNKNVLCNVLATNKNVMLCCLQMIFQYPFHAPITAVARERSRSFAESAGGRLQLNTHAPYVCGFA